MTNLTKTTIGPKVSDLGQAHKYVASFNLMLSAQPPPYLGQCCDKTVYVIHK